MGLYLPHADYYNTGNPEGKALEVIDFITCKLPSIEGDSYFIMDPYLDVVNDIQEPFLSSKVENSIWSWLIEELALPNITFNIITRETVDGILQKSPFPPYILPYQGTCGSIVINVCKYVDMKYCDMGLHDRFILRKRSVDIGGVHIGPSLADIHNKDVSLTLYTPSAADVALKAFNNIWQACIINKEWKK